MTTAKLKNSKPAQGMKLHKWIATGGNPKDRTNCGPNAVFKGQKEKTYNVPMGSK